MITIHTDHLAGGENLLVDGMLVTTPPRTAFDIGRRLDAESGVQRIDALMNATDVKTSDVEVVGRVIPACVDCANFAKH